MNVNQIVINALSPMKKPVSPNHYGGTAEEYIIFNYADERPIFHADDEEIFDQTEIQVHLFTRNNPQQYKKTIRRLLRSSGFSILNTQEFYESDTNYNHVVVECSINGEIND